MRYEICDFNEADMTVCWAIDGGKIFIHFTNDLGELLAFRKVLDEMIKGLEGLKETEDIRHKRELSLRAKRAKRIQK